MSEHRKLLVIASWLIWGLLIYVAGYVWFLRAHTLASLSTRFHYTEFAVGTADSTLLVLFYPALCVTATFDGERALVLTDAGGNTLPGRHMYPFAESRVHPLSLPMPSPTMSPVP